MYEKIIGIIFQCIKDHSTLNGGLSLFLFFFKTMLLIYESLRFSDDYS